MFKEISVNELKAKKDAKEPFVLVDVRENHEKAFSDMGGILIPLSKFESEYAKLEEFKNQEIILYCRSGARSAQAAMFLLSKGFTNVRNLVGGINKWAVEIDNSLSTY
ncbi:rhodanese-like domain-containing protein [bacterium]|nr:MAG: rhodanese-like domain-containing protein [bacterium]